jgi:hypothetical protein
MTGLGWLAVVAETAEEAPEYSADDWAFDEIHKESTTRQTGRKDQRSDEKEPRSSRSVFMSEGVEIPF